MFFEKIIFFKINCLSFENYKLLPYKFFVDFNISIDLRSRLKLRLHVISLLPATLGDVLWHRDFGTDALCVSIR